MEAVTFKKLVKGHAYSVTNLRQVSEEPRNSQEQIRHGSVFQDIPAAQLQSWSLA